MFSLFLIINQLVKKYSVTHKPTKRLNIKYIKMKKILFHTIVLIIFITGCQYISNSKLSKKVNTHQNSEQATSKAQSFFIHYESSNKEISKLINSWLYQGQKQIESFFNHKFTKPFDVYIFSDRTTLDEQLQNDWNMPEFKSECWMVASGTAYRLDILSPGVWKAQACEHDADDTVAVKKLLTHELVHVFHGQNNASPKFDSINNIDWFIEGLATYVSGQLSEDRYSRAKKFIAEDKGTDKLSDIWIGANRYGLAGSLVQFIDVQYGRNTLFSLLNFTTATEILRHLNLSEDDLIAKWKISFTKNT